jgi:exopolysaccharide production protein ExoQ
MSESALTLNGAGLLNGKTAERMEPRWVVAATALVIGVGFFVAGHSLNISLAEAYTQNAEEMEIAAAGGNALRRVAFLALGAWGVLLLVVSRRRLAIDPLLTGSIALLLGLAAVSFVWADDPGMCLRRLLILACCAVAALGIARAMTLRQISWLTVWTLGGLAAIGVLAELRLGTFRPWTSDYRFAGTVHPNTQGPGLATLCLAAFGLARGKERGRIGLWMVCGISLILLVLTKSRTTTAAVVLALASVQLVQTPLRTKVAGAAALVCLGCLGLWLVWICGYDPLTDFRDALLLGRAEESDTLSGRAFIWPEVMYYANQRLLFGHGYESFWTAGRIETISTALGWGLREAHNAYLELLLWLGVSGLALMTLVVSTGLAAAIRGFRATRDSAYTLPLGLLVFGLLNAGFESGMVVISLVPFVLGCCLTRLALFRDYAGGNQGP